MDGQALSGLLVAELSRDVAAAYCGRLLAIYGARVLLIEPPAGSALRSSGPFASSAHTRETGALFLTLAAGKESVTLDLASASGQAVLAAFCAKADVLLTDDLAALSAAGFDPARLKRDYPRLVSASVSPFGDSGPYTGFAATSSTLYALGGYTYITGDEDRAPLQGPEHQPEYVAGANTYTAVLAALLARGRTGRGQHVEVSVLEGIAAGHQWTLSRYAYNGRVQERSGNRYNSLHPVTYYPCADGVVGVSPSAPSQLLSMLQLIGREELLADPRFSTNPARMDNADAFDAEILPWFMARTRAEVSEACQAFRVPVAPAFDVAELLEHEQLVFRAYWQESSHPLAGEVRLPGPPWRMPDSPFEPGRAPLLGEQTSEACTNVAGLSPEDVAALREAGVL